MLKNCSNILPQESKRPCGNIVYTFYNYTLVCVFLFMQCTILYFAQTLQFRKASSLTMLQLQLLSCHHIDNS